MCYHWKFEIFTVKLMKLITAYFKQKVDIFILFTLDFVWDIGISTLWFTFFWRKLNSEALYWESWLFNKKYQTKEKSEEKTNLKAIRRWCMRRLSSRGLSGSRSKSLRSTFLLNKSNKSCFIKKKLNTLYTN